MKSLVILAVIVVLVTTVYFTYFHESVHQAIFKSYNINSEVDYWSWKHPLVATTTPESSCNNDSCTLANNINESVGYHLEPVVVLLGSGLVIITAFLSLQLKELEEISEKLKGGSY